MNYEVLARDFICRTLEIIDQYETHVLPHEKPENQYEVTLLTNCLLGLLVMPQQLAHHENWHNWLTDTMVADVGNEWGITLSNIISAGDEIKGKCEDIKREAIDKDTITIRRLIKLMRNSVAHISFDSSTVNGSNHIDGLIFRNDLGFHMTIPISNLRTFINKLAASTLHQLEIAIKKAS